MEQRNEELSRLVRDSQAGSRQAREELIEAIQGKVCLYCRMMINDQEEAMDAAQDVLVAVLDRLESLESPEAFQSWLRQIILRICRRKMKRVRREWGRQRSLQALPEEQEPVLAEGAGPEELAEREEVRQAVLALVNALPPQQRICIFMHYYEQMPIEEIAAALKVSPGTVKSRLYYARQTLRQGAEKSAGRGFPLCGVMPLLPHVFQMEAVGGLSAAASAGLTKAVMAAAGGSAVKGLLAVLTARRAAVLAALVLAAATVGGVLLMPERPDVREPVQVTEPEKPVEPVGPEKPAGPEKLPEPSRPEESGLPEARPGPVSAGPEIRKPSKKPAPGVLAEKMEEPLPLDVMLPPDWDAEPVIRDWMPDPDLDREPVVLPDPPSVPSQPSWTPDSSFPQIWPVNPGPSVPEEPDPPTPEEPDPPTPEEPDPPTPEEPDPPTPEEPDPPTPEEPDPPAPEEPDPPTPEDPDPPTPEEPDPPAPEEPDPPTPEEPEETVYEQVFVDLGGNGGYGYSNFFSNAWHGELPEGKLTYSSSDPEVVCINEEGIFTTMSPGTAVLSATYELPDGTVSRYELALMVKDRFRWDFTLPDIELTVGQAQQCLFSTSYISTLIGFAVEQESITWSSSDPGVAKVLGTDKLSCVVGAVSPGETVITATVTFRLDTAEGEAVMQDVCTCRVIVTEPPAPEEPTPPVPEKPNPPVPEEPDPPVPEKPNPPVPEEPTPPVPEKPDPPVPEEPTPPVPEKPDPPVPEEPDPPVPEEPDPPVPEEPDPPVPEEPTPPVPEKPDPPVPEEPDPPVPEKPDPPEIPAEPMIHEKELTEFGFNSGYGYQSTFAAEWGETLPEGLIYSSNDEAVVKVSETTGEFYTVSAGEAVITAEDPDAPDEIYRLTVRVQDCFQWRYTLEDLSLDVWQTAEHGFTDHVLLENTWTAYGIWSREDKTVVSLDGSTFWKSQMITGIRPGETTVTCEVHFEIKTFEGYVRMQDTASFRVRVAFSELEELGGEQNG